MEMGSSPAPTKNLAFGAALESVKYGFNLIARTGWNGKGQFVFMRPKDELSANFVVNTVKSLPAAFKKHIFQKYEGQDGNEIKIPFTPYLCLFNTQGEVVNGWVPSQGDLFAEDWEIINL